jgi:hypothetical protein
VNYFRPQQAGKIGPRTIHRFPDSTSRLSQKAGQVIPAKCAISVCLKIGVQSTRENAWIGVAAQLENALESILHFMSGRSAAW